MPALCITKERIRTKKNGNLPVIKITENRALRDRDSTHTTKGWNEEDRLGKSHAGYYQEENV